MFFTKNLCYEFSINNDFYIEPVAEILSLHEPLQTDYNIHDLNLQY